MCFVWISEQTDYFPIPHQLTGFYNRDGVCLLRSTDWICIYNSTFYPHSVFMCFVWISEQTAIISLYNINWLIFITEECVYCAVRAGSLCIVQINLCIWSVMFLNTEKLTETFPWTYIVCFSFRHTLALIFRMRSETQIYLHKSYALFLSDCNPNFVVWTNFKSPAYVIFRVNLFRHCQVISCVQTDRCGRTKRFY